jgi:hypothetical protein
MNYSQQVIEKLCSCCRLPLDSANSRYCLRCKARYMREWRRTHPLTPEQRFKDNARSYAGVYKRRGLLVPQPCACGSTDVQMHHPDYSQPLLVIWMCRSCHLALHHDEQETAMFSDKTSI